MAAYASVASLMNIVEHIQNHPRLSTSLDKHQIGSLGGKLDFLIGFLESYNPHGGNKEVEDLESQITSAAPAVEDVIKSHIVDQIHVGSTEKSPSFLFDLQKIIQNMDSVKEKVMKVKEGSVLKDQQPTPSTPAASSRVPLTTQKTTIVGFDGYLIQLLERLIGQESDLQVIPIIGMGGIGKTTLVRNLYEYSFIVEHFNIQVWVTVSQEYNMRQILLETLSCLGGSISEMDKEDHELGKRLHKILVGRRYLIILGDMWSIEVWNKIKFFFLENHDGSQIIVTSRISKVANHFGSSRFLVNFLNDDQSWILFCEKVFAPKDCPPELEEIGKMIVRKCKGLPLSVIVIGGLLRNSSRMQEYWEHVAKNTSSILNSIKDNPCLNILSLSYIHLPIYLKPCFVYLGRFPKDHEIHVSRLVKQWVAEGFIRPNKTKLWKRLQRAI